MESTPLRHLHSLLLVCFVVACVGCVVLQTRSAATRDDTPGQAIGPEKVTPEELRASVMGFVETYSAVMSQAADDLLQHGQPTPKRRLMAQLIKLASVESAVTIATSPNPMTALLDLMVLLTLQRQTWEEYWMPRIWGEDGRPMLAATTRLEAELWRIGSHALFPAQLEQVRGLIAQMRTQYGGQTYVTSMRASAFAKERLRSVTKTITQLNEALLTARAVLESPVIAGNGSRLQTVMDQSRAEVQGVIDSAYRKGLALIVAFAMALFVALTGARVVGTWLEARLAGRRRQEPS